MRHKLIFIECLLLFIRHCTRHSIIYLCTSLTVKHWGQIRKLRLRMFKWFAKHPVTRYKYLRTIGNPKKNERNLANNPYDCWAELLMLYCLKIKFAFKKSHHLKVLIHLPKLFSYYLPSWKSSSLYKIDSSERDQHTGVSSGSLLRMSPSLLFSVIKIL